MAAGAVVSLRYRLAQALPLSAQVDDHMGLRFYAAAAQSGCDLGDRMVLLVMVWQASISSSNDRPRCKIGVTGDGDFARPAMA